MTTHQDTGAKQYREMTKRLIDQIETLEAAHSKLLSLFDGSHVNLGICAALDATAQASRDTWLELTSLRIQH